VQFNPTGLVVAAMFYGLLWYGFARGVDYNLVGALGVVALNVPFALLGVFNDSRVFV
jgi:hypothetical protein